ncbi:MAG: YHS domain-containing protein [Thermodesulfobacteriota bacterium]
MALDPVCGMDIKEEDATGKVEYEGRTYYFCSEGCKEKFAKEPAKYTGEGE